MRNVIAIDGYTGTGKGTTAKIVADRLGRLYLDTGAMYRAATYLALRDGWIDVSDDEKVARLAKYRLHFEKNQKSGHQDMRVDDENIESFIRSTELGLAMKPIVTCRPLRRVLEQMQRQFADYQSLVADGRDMGTVVFPDAQWKFFLTCDIDIRTERRYEQLLRSGKSADKDLIRLEIQQRDQTDYLGLDAVNKKADDAIEIDTSYLSIEEQVQNILDYVGCASGSV